MIIYPSDMILAYWLTIGSMLIDFHAIEVTDSGTFTRAITLRSVLSEELENLPLTPSVCELYEFLRFPKDDAALDNLLANLINATRNN